LIREVFMETREKEVVIRTARQQDAQELLSIYAPYVEKTAITF